VFRNAILSILKQHYKTIYAKDVRRKLNTKNDNINPFW